MSNLFTQHTYSARRKRLMQLMGKQDIAIIFSASEQIRNRDVHYPFRQNSDFYYLTGFEEPEAVAVLLPEKDVFLLFCEENHAETALWTGEKSGTEGAVSQYGANEAWDIDTLDERMPELLADKSTVYFSLAESCEQDSHLSQWMQEVNNLVRTGVQAPSSIRRLQDILHELRLVKSAEEVQAMREAAKISAHAHCEAMRACRPSLHEYHLEAVLKQAFMQAGCRQEAYSAIVGGGDNGCVLHYTENNSPLQSGDLVLIDAGAERENYAADITRTFPINGKFSTPQKILYELVLDAQRAAIDKVKPGATFDEPHKAAVRVLTQGLIREGLLNGTLEALLDKEAYKTFYMHRTGHWLGLDVHDVGAYKIKGKWRELVPGMVLTIEPGLYIPRQSHGVDRQWRGMGIRIEDDVLVTPEGCEILSQDVPKTVHEIECLMQG